MSGVSCVATLATVVAAVLWSIGGGTQDTAAVASNHTPPYPVPTARPMTVNASESRQATEKVEVSYNPSKVDDTFTNTIGMKLTYIPAGEFVMGSPAGEEGRSDNETQHRVRITCAFLMGATEVTQAQWRAVMGNNPSFFKGENLPVEQVSWEDAQEFCRKLSEREGKQYRLPTEAEWEYACRAGTTTEYHTGNGLEALKRAGWASYDGHYGAGKTTPAGRFASNAWGLYDMHGNVFEWCGDWYGDYPKDDAVDRAGPTNGTLRVLRGGSWYVNPRLCRAAYRGWNTPGGWGYGFGFRVVMVLPPDQAQDNAAAKSPKQVSAAANAEAKEVVKPSIIKDTDVNAKDKNGTTPLHVAALGNNKEKAEQLIAKGADVNAKGINGMTPLHRAATGMAKEVAQLLIEEGADVNAKDNNRATPLHEAAKGDDKEVAELLIANGADMNAKDNNGQTPLHEAIGTTSTDVAELLIAKRADVNAKNNNAQTPLHYASIKNAKRVAQLLIAKEADTTAKANNSLTPLHEAIKNNSKEVSELLISEGAGMNAGDSNGNTPLHLAVLGNAKDLVRLLISKGADVNTRENTIGMTPLHVAAMLNTSDIAELLIAEGADVNATMNNGMTPLDVATAKNAWEVTALLRSHGAME